ncbi:hypothetical protein Zmor_000334 [Zophobas morio]|uniref:Endonuclease/exonuclease/phosphatase domain-containing protein n=1 Tax=Zophobas morio TaxID=2755281 RepID=A0AA38MQI5_9CUCU|nr:hypothetical protein Zmor_000334 [Zophobas morio]
MAQWQLCYAIFSPKKPTEKIHLAAHNAYEDNPGKRLMSETDNSHTSRKTALGVNWLNLFYLNIQSLRRKVNDLELHLSDNPPHIVCFSEHWLTAAEVEILTLLDYKVASSFCRKKGYGGAAILIRPNVRYSELNLASISKQTVAEVAGIFLTEYRVNIITIYRPPDGDFEEFLYLLNLLLLKLDDTCSFLIGDFNILFNNPDHKVKSFLDLINSFHMRTLITENTRKTNCLDNIVTNSKVPYKINISHTRLSDHDAVSLQLNCISVYQQNGKTTTYRPVTQRGLNLFHSQISEINWDHIINITEAADLEHKWDEFVTILSNAAIKSFPLRTFNSSKLATVTGKLAAAQSNAQNWFHRNGLYLNKDKTSTMIFSTRYIGIDNPNHTKFLGITLDTTLCWEAHVDVLSKKLAKTIYLLPYSRAILRMLLRLGDIQHIFPEFSNFRGKQFV